MNKSFLLIQLAALVAIACGQQLQQQQQQFGAGVESPELLRRRQEFQAAARAMAQSQKALQEDFQRSVAMANRERQEIFQQQQQQQQQQQLQQQQAQQAQRVAGGLANRQQFLSSPIEQAPQRVAAPVPTAPALQRHQLGQKVLPQDRLTDREEELFRKQALSAKYSFNSAINDGIMDNTHTREETRDGLKVAGSYSYSDGYFHRTVYYEADENGYRVVKEETEPIGNGPLVDLEGSADISTSIDGVDSQYRITAADIGRFKVRDELSALNPRKTL